MNRLDVIFSERRAAERRPIAMDTAAADPNNVATGGGEPLAELASAMFWPLGADGVYGRTALFERIVDGLSLLISSHREPETEALRLPPVMSRTQLETS